MGTRSSDAGRASRTRHNRRVLTLRTAAELLTADDPDALARLAAVCGCPGIPNALDAADRERLGLGAVEAVTSGTGVRVARGPGNLRALLLDL